MHYCHIHPYCGIYYFSRIIVNTVTAPTPSWLPQVSLSTNVKLYDTSSRTTLTQLFVNPSKKEEIEQAKYNFPLYESCAVVAFRCFVQGRLIEGVVKEKNEAKVDYDAAIDRGETAGLLEQITPDVFRTSLGNIPAGATVKVEVEYIMELKHDAEADGLRFTIPTSIAPRYGDAPSGLSTYRDGRPIQKAVEKGGMKISVQITMPRNVQSVQSPSHPISVHLGGHVENVSDDSFNTKHALATLGQTSTELGKDFILLVKCADLSSPRALLETHSTKPNSRALMVTLVPKFTLPPGPKPEIVFIVDRSGSMENRIKPLKSALSVFLKSLPIGVKFNICSFGSKHSFLWKTSRPYSADTLEQAQRHTEAMNADMGGTEILAPIKAAVNRRYKDLPLEIMVLTDGEVWNTEALLKFIEEATTTGDVRLFSLGIGEDVSHSLVEGMARVGRGLAQIVSNGHEGIEGKVVRMLRAGLNAHVNDYRLEWDGMPTETRIWESTKGKNTRSKKKINLFDVKADTDAPIQQSGADRFSHLPEFTLPAVLQAPYKLPPLFPFSRCTVYVILTGDTLPPSSVWLRGTTPSGDELELEIPVQVLPERAHTIHQLAARKLLQELEEGTGYLHSGKYGINKEDNPGTFVDWVDREGIRVGVEYGLASKWTSFVAVTKKRKEGLAAHTDDEPDLHDLVIIDSDYATDDENDENTVTPRPEVAFQEGSNAVRLKKRKFEAPNAFLLAQNQTASSQVGLSGHTDRKAQSSKAPRQQLATKSCARGSLHGRERAVALRQRKVFTEDDNRSIPSTSQRLLNMEAELDECCDIDDDNDGGHITKAALLLRNPRQRAGTLISLQSFDGSFSLTEELACVLGVPLKEIQAKLMEYIPVASETSLPYDQMEALWATVLAVVVFETKLSGKKEMWELVVTKARDWISGLPSVVDEDVKRLETLASEVLVN